MPKDASSEAQKPELAAEPAPAAPSPKLAGLRGRFAEVQKRVTDLTLERVEPSAKAEQKGHVVAKWARTRVAHVVEPPFSIDDSECAVIEVTLAQFKGA